MSNLQFEPDAGQNVKLSKDRKEATWMPNQSAGWVYSACAMQTGVSVTIELDGSGHCVVGFTTANPDFNGPSREMHEMKKLHDIRLHKRTCKISLALQENTKEVFSVFEGHRNAKKVGKATKVWIAAYVKFGNVSMILRSKGSQEERLLFSSNHGTNIRLEDRNQKAQTISNNPAAVCFLNINRGETIQFHCSPITEGSRDPSRYYMNMQVSNSPPTALKRDFCGLFDACADQCSKPSLTSLEVLDKEACKGNISLCLDTNNILKYITSSGKRNQQTLHAISPSRVWMVLELYRVSVKLIQRTKESKSSTMMCGSNVTDAQARDPSNCTAENSIDVFRAPCPVPEMPYVSVTEVKEIMKKKATIPPCTGYTSMPESEVIMQRMDRMEQKQEEMLQLLHDKGTQQSNTSWAGQEEQLSSSLQPNWVELVNTMRVDSLCDHLYQWEIIDEHDMNRILSLNKDDQRGANRRLLNILMKKNVNRSLLARILDDAQESHLKSLFNVS